MVICSFTINNDDYRRLESLLAQYDTTYNGNELAKKIFIDELRRLQPEVPNIE